LHEAKFYRLWIPRRTISKLNAMSAQSASLSPPPRPAMQPPPPKTLGDENIIYITDALLAFNELH
jgi:hypothetical protein